MNQNITIREERISPEEYIDFLKRTDLGSQYPKERFEERVAKLVKNVSVSLVAKNEDNKIVGVLEKEVSAIDKNADINATAM